MHFGVKPNLDLLVMRASVGIVILLLRVGLNVVVTRVILMRPRFGIMSVCMGLNIVMRVIGGDPSMGMRLHVNRLGTRDLLADESSAGLSNTRLLGMELLGTMVLYTMLPHTGLLNTGLLDNQDFALSDRLARGVFIHDWDGVFHSGLAARSGLGLVVQNLGEALVSVRLLLVLSRRD